MCCVNFYWGTNLSSAPSFPDRSVETISHPLHPFLSFEHGSRDPSQNRVFSIHLSSPIPSPSMTRIDEERSFLTGHPRDETHTGPKFVWRSKLPKRVLTETVKSQDSRSDTLISIPFFCSSSFGSFQFDTVFGVCPVSLSPVSFQMI